MPDPDTYHRLIELLDEAAVGYRLIDHEPEGTTEKVSGLRGHPVSLAAKCIILIVKPDKRTTRHVLAVVPGDCRVDLDAIKQLYGARYVGFADHATAERLARTVPGTVLPLSLDPALDLVADPAVIAESEIYFNAARLDRSIMLSGADYKTLAQPRIEPIALHQSK